MPKSQKSKEVVVQCPGCGTRFIRKRAGKEKCGICGDGKERMFKEVKQPFGKIKARTKKHAKASGRTAK